MNGQVYAMEMIPSGWIVVVGPESTDFHGLACIKGRWVVANKDNWAYNRTVYVPVAHIKSIAVFESVEEYYDAGKRSRLADFPQVNAQHEP